jgi:hypothetical protein
MSGFANSGDIPFLIGFVAVIAALAGVLTIVTRRLRPNASKAAVAIGSGLALPALIFGLGFAAFMLIPAGDSPDGPGMLLAGVIGLTIVALPISLITSVLVVSMRRR